MAILNNNPLVGASGNQGGYNINNSLRFRGSASAYLNRTPASAGNRRTWTWSAWIKLGKPSDFYALFGSTNNCFIGYGQSTGGANLGISDGNTSTMNVQTTALFRDPSAWYHFVVALDTTQATAANRVKIYVNGNQQTAFVASTYPSQNAEFNINNTTAQNIGRTWDGFQYFDGYMTDINFIDGQALTPSSFGETDTTTGVWKPKAYSGTYGTNGFYLKFSDIATTSGSNAGLGKDFSGNSNYWTTNNISVTSGTTYDAMTDSPTLTSATVANYCVLNPLNITTSSANTEANLKFTNNAGAAWKATSGTFAVTSGKYYWEVVFASTTSGYGMAGVLNPNNYFISGKTEANYWSSSSSYSYYGNNGNVFTGDVGSSYGNTYTNGDIIGVALDMDNGKIYFSKNGTWQNSGNPATGTNPAYSSISSPLSPAVSTLENGANAIINFGQRPFSYTPPTGFVALNTYNLPTPTILQGNKYMDATLWTGDGTLSRNITGLNFATDFVWLKSRGADSHKLYDIIRGAGNNKELESNTTVAEGGSNSDVYGYMSAFLSNGFTVAGGTDSGFPVGLVNQSGQGYVAWNWKANGTGVTNTSGSITSTVSVNTTAGFSIVTYTGTGATATVGHGLGVAPKMIIVKNRNDGTTNWAVYHVSTGANAVLFLNSTATPTTVSGKWGTPSSTTFGVNTAADVNANTQTMVAYCFAEIAGFSKFGSYTGNGSTDGPFIFLGFRPKFVMIKRTDGGTNNWVIFDSSRNTYNATGKELKANTSAAEYDGDTTNPNDFLSNGLKIRHDGTAMNISSGTYIYMAFAENPFKNANAR